MKKILIGIGAAFMLVFVVWPLCVHLYYAKEVKNLYREHSRIYHDNNLSTTLKGLDEKRDRMMEIRRKQDEIYAKKARLIFFY